MEHFHGHADHICVSSVQGCLDWDDQLRNDGQDLASAFLKDIKCSLHSEESVWVQLLSETFEEDWKIMMEVQLGDIDFPGDSVTRSLVFDDDGKISSFLVSSELTDWDLSSLHGSCLGLRDSVYSFRSQLRGILPSEPSAFLQRF